LSGDSENRARFALHRTTIDGVLGRVAARLDAVTHGLIGKIRGPGRISFVGGKLLP